MVLERFGLSAFLRRSKSEGSCNPRRNEDKPLPIFPNPLVKFKNSPPPPPPVFPAAFPVGSVSVGLVSKPTLISPGPSRCPASLKPLNEVGAAKTRRRALVSLCLKTSSAPGEGGISFRGRIFPAPGGFPPPPPPPPRAGKKKNPKKAQFNGANGAKKGASEALKLPFSLLPPVLRELTLISSLLKK